MPSERCRPRISPRMSCRNWASRFDSGSSIRHTGASAMIARPSATRCCWPPDSCPGLRSSSVREAQEVGHALQARRGLRRRHLAHLEAEHDVLGHDQMRKQRVALEHHRDVPLRRRQVGDVTPRDADAPAVGLLETGDQPQRGRLAAPGRTEQHVERARIERKGNAVDGAHLTFGGRPVLADVFGNDSRHEGTPRRGTVFFGWIQEDNGAAETRRR